MNQATNPNYYQILHVQQDAPVAIIKASYRALMQTLKQHPDLGGDAEHAAQLNQAYQTLTDATLRSQYNQQLNSTPPVVQRQTATKNICCPFCQTLINTQQHPLNDQQSCNNCQSPLISTSNTSPTNCQRIITRLPKTAGISFYTTWPQAAIHGNMQDLSPFGLRFLTKKSLHNGLTIKIDTSFLQAIARVSYCQAWELQIAVGVEFITLRFEQARGNFLSLTT